MADKRFVCLKDFEEEALRILPKFVADFYSCGAEEQHTLKDNIQAFQRWKIRPRMLRNVSTVDLSTSILGHHIDLPVCVTPTGFHALAHTEAEIGTAKGTHSMHTVFTVSSYSTVSIDRLQSQVPDGLHFFQLYLLGIPNKNQIGLEMIERAAKHGFKAVVITVDLPVLGKRYTDFRNDFKINVSVPELERIGNEGLDYYTGYDANLTWDDISWLKERSPLPIILKGILTAEDALLAVKTGVAGILVSNHGARQLDTVLSTIDALPEVVAAVAGRCEVYLDGGIRHGTDVFKALALGARAVFIGRPALYGLACRGASGVEQVLQILKDELCTAMALSGCSSVRDITRDMVIHQYNHWAKL